jgi:hypothetical protein
MLACPEAWPVFRVLLIARCAHQASHSGHLSAMLASAPQLAHNTAPWWQD